ncbi:MAG: PAS domain S-box protein [Chloroflexi bacterium]|nr:MAG: PAS domain S-box protein [Chloroflexota bacterium]
MSVVEGAGRRPGAETTRAGLQTGAPGMDRPAQPSAIDYREPPSALPGDSPFEWAAALYRSIVDISPDAITVTTIEGKIILCNQQAATLYGVQRADEMIGRSAWDFVAAEDLDRASRDLLRIFSEGTIRNVEYSLLRSDGGRVPVELSASAITAGDGNPRALIGVVRDVSERRTAEEALRRSEEHFRHLIENAPDLITVIEPSGELRYQSPSVRRTLGYTPDELVGTNIWRIIHPDDRRTVGDAIARGLLEAQSAESTMPHKLLVFRAQHKDGRWRYLEGSGKVITEEGRAYGLINSRDITDSVEAERALEASERRKAAILETALDAIITIDSESKILEFNPAAEVMFGRRPEEAIGQRLDELIVPPSLRGKHQRGMHRYLTTGKGPVLGKRIELAGMRADGSEFPVELAIVPIEMGETTIFTGHVRDLTERKRAEEELQQAREELESRVEQRLGVAGAYGLTFRELTVLHLVSSGRADKEIAATLGIRPKTVNKHVQRILHKMGASSRTEVGVRAIRERIVG